jgi:hypothetical protein
VYTAQATGTEATINTAAFAKGVYVVRVTGSGKTSVKKLMVGR